MTKKKAKKRNHKWFFLGMAIYTVLFLGATAAGLHYLWGVLEEYEAKESYRKEVTQNPIDAYMDQLTAEHISGLSEDVIAQIDHNIQSEEQCRQFIADSLTGEFTRRKYITQGNQPISEYAIFCGDRNIGKVTTTSRTEEQYGFTVWDVTSESYDVSYLIGEKITVTAPHNYTVSINGQALDSSYIIESGKQYALLTEFYGDYEIPYHIVTYEAGPFLGQLEAVITDPKGNPVQIDESTDWNAFICTCSPETVSVIDSFLADFIQSYVKFTSSKENRFDAYYAVIKYMVSGGDLASRMYRALDGLQYNKIVSAKLQTVTLNHCVDIGNDRYMCDLTYETNINKREGEYLEVNNLKLILVETSKGLQVEAMISY